MTIDTENQETSSFTWRDRIDSLDVYQELTSETAVYPADRGLEYCTLGLVGEAGEVAEKVKKIIRDNNGDITPEKAEEIKKEIGDTLWYLAQLTTTLGFHLSDVAKTNLDKLFSRKERGKLKGSGDNR